VEIAADQPTAVEADAESLSWWSLSAILIIVLALFAAINPIWRTVNINEFNTNVLWSYIPIPFLVAAFLAIEHKLRTSTWLLETLKLTLIKFCITFAVANTMWGIVGPPPAVLTRALMAVHHRSVEPPSPEPTLIDPNKTGDIVGVVVDDNGAPVTGAIVYIAGLEHITFAVPDVPVRLFNDGTGVNPRLAIVHRDQPVSFASADGTLHTAQATTATGRIAFTYPATPHGRPATKLSLAPGVVTIDCTVHGSREQPAYLLISSNPFATITRADGRFSFSSVPAGDLELKLLSLDRRENRRVTLRAGNKLKLALSPP